MERRIGKYIIGETLGKGGFSKVKLGVNSENGQRVALKLLKKDKLATSSSTQRQVEREIMAMTKIHHPNVIRLYEVDWNARYPKKKGQVIDVILVVLELATGGELFEFLSITGCFDESIARTYYHQLISALECCHSHEVAHRDLKPENLLLDGQFMLKLADFGFASIVNDAQLTFTECGTPGYMAPEMLARKGYDARLADLWASGVIVFIMLAGFPPFQRPADNDWWFDKLVKGKHALFWQAHSRSAAFSENFKDFINKLLQPDPSRRLTLEGVKAHPWFLGSTLNDGILSAELARRKQTVDLEKARQKMEKKAHPGQASMDDSMVRGGTGAVMDEAGLPICPPTLTAWKVVPDVAPGFERPMSNNMFSSNFDQGDEVAESKLQPPVHSPQQVACYTRFHSTQPASVLLRRIAATLSEFSQVSTSDAAFRIKGSLSTESEKVFYNVQLYSVPEKPGVVLCEFRRRQGDSVQYQHLFDAACAQLGDVIVDVDRLA